MQIFWAVMWLWLVIIPAVVLGLAEALAWCKRVERGER